MSNRDLSNQLPNMGAMNIAALSQLFSNVTNSYKFLFFWASIELFHKRNISSDGPIVDIKDIVIEMLALAWFPHTFFRLSFGVQDQVGAVLDAVKFDVKERRAGLATTQERLRRTIEEQYEDIKAEQLLLQHVQFRLLQPFFSEELSGEKDHKKNKLTEDLATQSFNSNNPSPYRFHSNGKKIEVHHAWGEYFTNNYSVMIGWVKYHWVNYLQRKNPNIPSIPLKIEAPLKRDTLKRQRDYWKQIVGQADIRCIYSNDIIRPDSFDLDHFLPWSFVCHDQLWNLVPVVSEVNSSKGNRLPSVQYIKPFVEVQHFGLIESSGLISKKKWQNTVEPYVGDLHLTVDEILTMDRLLPAYRRVLKPMIDLASQSGFAAGWKYGV